MRLPFGDQIAFGPEFLSFVDQNKHTPIADWEAGASLRLYHSTYRLLLLIGIKIHSLVTEHWRPRFTGQPPQFPEGLGESKGS
jgi:hypothetical protein